MNKKQRAFLLDLDSLMKRYGVVLADSDQYNGKDEYCGTEYSFCGEGIDVDTSKMDALISEARREHQ